MKVWKMRFMLDEFASLYPQNRWSLEKIQSFDGRIHMGNWNIEELVMLEPEKRKPLGNEQGY